MKIEPNFCLGDRVVWAGVGWVGGVHVPAFLGLSDSEGTSLQTVVYYSSVCAAIVFQNSGAETQGLREESTYGKADQLGTWYVSQMF